MNLCLCNFFIEILELPPFLPNDYLFETHHDKLREPLHENLVLQSLENDDLEL
jgi:hypothetical protein